jgi:predicted PolB exonuclease-like 3'-5' exonuclease
MTTVLVFDIETIPDVDGLRRLEDFPASMADSDVAQQLMQLRLEKTGSDFLPLYLQRIVAISDSAHDQRGFAANQSGLPRQSR